jgi:glycosyltransferase involved in cell wall biosynthesis
LKLIIQIPCFNEADSLPETLVALPRKVVGADIVEFLVIDDGSSDGTGDVARRFGVQHVVRHRRNRGLAAAFQTGIDAALAAGADIIVNTDADNQYEARDIEKLIEPIVRGCADIVVGDRGVRNNAHFGPVKRKLQMIGSAIVQRLANTDVPDAVSGFRAISRAAAQRICIVSDFSYTTEMLIQAGRNRMAILSVPVRTNAVSRPSRLFDGIPHFIVNTGLTMARAYAMYNPLRLFVLLGAMGALAGFGPIARFLYFFALGQGQGHVQSLILGGVLMILGMLSIMLGIVADLVGRNRQLLESLLVRMRQVEEALPKTEQDRTDGDAKKKWTESAAA